MSDRTLYEINGEIPSDVWNDLRRRVEDGSLVPVEPVGTLTVGPLWKWWVDATDTLPPGNYLIMEADDE